MIRDWKKPIIFLLLGVGIILIVAYLAPGINRFLDSRLNDNSQYHYDDYPTFTGLNIPPGSSNHFYIQYPTTRLLIKVGKGNISEIQPMVLDSSGFLSYSQGTPFSPVVGPDKFEKNFSSNRFVYNSSIDMGNYLLIKNNDKNDSASVTVWMYAPM